MYSGHTLPTLQFISLCFIIVLAVEQKQSAEMSHVCQHSCKMALVRGWSQARKIKGLERRENGSSSQKCPWLMSSVFQCFNIGFQLAQTLIPDQSPVDVCCITAQLSPALGSAPR